MMGFVMEKQIHENYDLGQVIVQLSLNIMLSNNIDKKSSNIM